MSVVSKLFAFVLLAVLLLPGLSFAESRVSDFKVILYENEACGHCKPYVSELKQYLNSIGVTDIQEKFMINDEDTRVELEKLHTRLNVSVLMRGHLVVDVDDKYLFEGHVPVSLIGKFLLEDAGKYSRMTVLQDKMSGAVSYKLQNDLGEIKDCELTEDVASCDKTAKASFFDGAILPVVLTTGLIDGINPCAIAVLLFFISLLFTLHKSKADIFQIGAIYIFAVFLTYLLIGLGILKTIELFPDPHAFAKIASVLVIVLGLINIKDYFWYGKWVSLKTPVFFHRKLASLMKTTSKPGVFVVGILVGLCTLPCSGGIYVAIIGMLAAKTAVVDGLLYLVVYNVMFVLPLVVLLLLSSSKQVVEQMRKLEVEEHRLMNLALGIVMIVLGLAIFLGVI